MHDDHGHDDITWSGPGQKPHESPLVVTLPLILLAIPRSSSVSSRSADAVWRLLQGRDLLR
jgi:hypothetical protein